MTDTLTIARDLEASGIDRKQAEAIAAAIGKSEERTATKGDIDTLKGHIDTVRSEMRWAFGILFALVLFLAVRVYNVI